MLEFDPEGNITTSMVTPAMLGLQPRDVSLFKTTAGPGKQRATITVREGRILFRSEHCQAIVAPDRAYLFPNRCDGPALLRWSALVGSRFAPRRPAIMYSP